MAASVLTRRSPDRRGAGPAVARRADFDQRSRAEVTGTTPADPPGTAATEFRAPTRSRVARPVAGRAAVPRVGRPRRGTARWPGRCTAAASHGEAGFRRFAKRGV